MSIVRQLNVLQLDGTREIRSIGALGINISIGYDSSGNIITDSTTQSSSKSASQVLKDLNTSVNSKAATNHSSTKTTYGVADASYYGHVKIGSNITNSDGTISLTKANVVAALGYTPPTANTTYSAATTSAAGLMSAADKSKLDSIASGANAYTLPTASNSTLGGVKVGNNITLTSGILSLTKDNVISALGYTPPTSNTTYSTGTTSSLGLTKLYGGVGTATDGTMTQAAINTQITTLKTSISNIEDELNSAASQLKDL